MKHAAIYAMGIVTGCAALVLADRFLPSAEAAAPAVPSMAMAQDASGGSIIAVTGGIDAQREDVLWLIHARPTTEDEAKTLGEPKTHVSIVAYRLPRDANKVDIPLSAWRNATADLLLPMYVPEERDVSLDIPAVVKRLKDAIAAKAQEDKKKPKGN